MKVVGREAGMKELGSSCMGNTVHKLAIAIKQPTMVEVANMIQCCWKTDVVI